MVAKMEIICTTTTTHTTAVQYMCVPSPTSSSPKIDPLSDFFDVPEPSTPISLIDLSRFDSGFSCSTSIQTTTTVLETPTNTKLLFTPKIRSGSHTDIGPRSANEDQHIRIDNLSTYLGSPYSWAEPSCFYAVFDGHGGPDAAAYLKNNAMKFFFEEADLPQTSSDIDEKFWQNLETSHRRSFLLADRALADENSIIDSYCGTTAITALVIGRHLLIANAGDCRAVLCRKGDAVQLSQDHRPSCEVERKRVEDLGGSIEYGYLNGELAVTRALGDWYMKLPFGSASPLTAEPEFQRTFLTEDDEFLILGCDGMWDVLSNQEAVSIVRRELRRNNDPQQCARELINQALKRDTCDNITAIVVCFSSPPRSEDCVSSQRPRFRFCMSEESRAKLRSLLEGN